MTLPAASFTVARACVFPLNAIEVESSRTVTVVTTGAGGGGAGRTVMFADPFLSATVASIAAVPGATAVTAPDDDTVATEGESDFHETVWPDIVLPDASLAVADAFAFPLYAIDEESSCTVTVVTTGAGGATGAGGGGGGGGGCLTVMLATPVLPAIVASTLTGPALNAEIVPSEEMAATAGASDLQLTL